jgi:hypothetical protein
MTSRTFADRCVHRVGDVRTVVYRYRNEVLRQEKETKKGGRGTGKDRLGRRARGKGVNSQLNTKKGNEDKQSRGLGLGR